MAKSVEHIEFDQGLFLSLSYSKKHRFLTPEPLTCLIDINQQGKSPEDSTLE